MSGGVVHVGGQPDDVAHPAPGQLAQHPGQLVLAAAGRAGQPVGHALDVGAVRHDQPDREVRRDDLPGGRRGGQPVGQPAGLPLTQHVPGTGARRGVGVLVAAHVHHEDLEMRPVAEAAVDPAVHGLPAVDGLPLVERLKRPRGKDIHALLGVGGQVEDLPGIPVVDHFVVVPLNVGRHPGGEGPHVGVEQIVGELAAVLGERLGHLRLLRRDEVAPDPAVGQRHGIPQRAVGVDGVAAVDEEVRVARGHRGVGGHAAGVRVDPPALPSHIAGPGEPRAGAADRRGAERADQRLTGRPAVEVLRAHPVEHLAARGQRGQPEFAGAVGVRGQHGSAQPAGMPEGRVARHLHQHPRRPVGPGPHDRAGAGHIAGLHPVGQHRPALPQQRRRRRQRRRAKCGGRTDPQRPGAQHGAPVKPAVLAHAGGSSAIGATAEERDAAGG